MAVLETTTPQHVVGLVVVTTMIVLLMPVFLSAWRDGKLAARVINGLMQAGYSRRVSVATLRGACFLFPFFGLLSSAAILKSLARNMTAYEQLWIRDVLDWGTEVLTTTTVAISVLYTFGILFGRPKWVFPTALRNFPGLLTADEDGDETT